MVRTLLIVAVLIGVLVFRYFWRPSRVRRRLSVQEIGLLLTVLALLGLTSASKMLSKAGTVWLLVSLLALQLAAILWVVPKGKRLVPALCAIGSSVFAWVGESMVTLLHVPPRLWRVLAASARLALPLYVVSFGYILFYLALTMRDLIFRRNGHDRQ